MGRPAQATDNTSMATSNTQIETVSTGADKAKLAASQDFDASIQRELGIGETK